MEKHSKLLMSCFVLVCVLSPNLAFGLFGKPKKGTESYIDKKKSQLSDNGYTVNFDNISALELVKFISRIANQNFIYDANDLSFNITFTSDEPTSLSNILSAFAQILRMHGLILLEDGNNLVITRSEIITQIPTIVSPDHPLSSHEHHMFITRVFTIHNANPANIEAIIHPMISSIAQIILSKDTRQLIITEIASNIEKIAELLSILDQPKSSLDIVSYRSQNVGVRELAPLLTQIITPIAEGNPTVIVPQPDSNTLFFVSTTYLCHKAEEILKELDMQISVAGRALGADNIMVYPIKYRSADSIMKSLKEIAESAQGQGFFTSSILSAIQTANYIKPTHSLLLIGEAGALQRIKTLIDTFDVPAKPDNKAESSKFYVYEPTSKSAVEIMSFLQDIEKHLKDSHLSDPLLLQALSTARVVKDANSIIFTGDEMSITQIKDLLKSLDLTEFNSKDEYFIYTPINVSSETLLESLKQMAERLSKSGLTDVSFIESLKEANYATYSHAIVFTGSKDAIVKIKALMNELDHPNQKELSDQNILIYQLKYVNKATLEKSLDKFAETLPLESSIHEAIETAAWMPEANSVIFRGSSDTLKNIKEIVDTTDTAGYGQEIFLNYRVQNAPFSTLELDLNTYASHLDKDDPTKEVIKNARWIPESKLIMFKGNKASIDKITSLLQVSDHPASSIPEGQEQSYFLYNLQSAPGSLILKEFSKIISKLKEEKVKNAGLIKSIENIEWVKTTNSLFISGMKSDIDQVTKLIAKFDVPQKATVQVVVALKHVSGGDLLAQLKSSYKKLDSSDYAHEEMLSLINNIEWIKASNSLFISGPTKEVAEIEKFIQGLDIASAESVSKTPDFFVYTPIHIPPKQFSKAIEKLAYDLKESKLSDFTLISSLEQMRYNEETGSFVFTGNEPTLTRVKELLTKIDIDRTPYNQTKFYFYKPVNFSQEEFEKAVNQSIANLKKTGFEDEGLLKVLETMRFVKSSRSFVFTGSLQTIANLESFLKDLDQPISETNNNVLMYHPTNTPVDALFNSVEKFTKDLENRSFTDTALIDALKSMRVLKGSNALVFTGNKETLPQVEDFVKRLDTVAPFISTNAQTHFFMYKPKTGDAKQMETAMKNIATDLEKSGLANPELIKSINSVRYVSSTGSLVFTGADEVLNRVKELVTQVETDLTTKTGIQQVGKTTFFIYKVKDMDPHQLMSSLTQMARDLAKSKGADPAVIKTIEEMRFVPDNQSIIFTGPEEALKQVQEMIKEFDLPYLSKKRVGTDTYLLYKPKNMPGDELIHLAKDFEQNLVNSGVSEPELFDTINNLKWMPKTGQILISGTEEATKKVVGVVEKFDIHTEKKSNKTSENAIETLDNVSFLIYKLQFHQGADIQGVLAGVANDLTKSGGKGSVALVKAINSIQWLKVTNSFIATGEPNTLVKLKELLESIDIPLRQVFIEVLIIETELDGRLEFGLQWGGQGTYKDRLAFSANNSPIDLSSNSGTTTGFSTLLPKINATNTPTGSEMPLPTGGSFGAIGDLIFSQGKTYVTLGDFVNAIQTDSDSTIVLNQQLVAQDNQNSTLFVGQNVPYNGSVVQQQGQVSTISSNIEYRDIGIQLSLTPHIGDNGIVSIEIDESVTENETSGSSSGTSVNEIFGIQTAKTTMHTSVHVPDKHFVILSGQIRNSTVRVKTGIPCLGGLPIIGAAFSQSLDTKVRSNIVMFMRPVIINSYEEYQKITKAKESQYREQTIAEDFDAGVELTKDLSNED